MFIFIFILMSLIIILSSILILLKLLNTNFDNNTNKDPDKDTTTPGISTTPGNITTPHPISTNCPADNWISNNDCSYSRMKVSGEVPTYYFRETFTSGKGNCKKTQIREFKRNSRDNICEGSYTVVG